MKVLILLFIVSFKQYVLATSESSSCPTLYLTHGRITTMSSGNKVKLKCNKSYVLIGEETIICNNGTWSSSFHICARKNCPKLPKIFHGNFIITKKALAKPICDPNFTLIGPRLLYCDDGGWNDTTLPQCLAQEVERFKPCHFEVNDPKHCQWLLNSSTYKWVVYPFDDDQFNSNRDISYPLIDHTFTPHEGGHYMLLMRNTGSKYLRKSNISNGEAKFISPLFPAMDENSNETLCLVFYYYLNGPHSGSLKVLINDKIVWTNPTHTLDYKEWSKTIINLQNQYQQFRITITGIGEVEETPGIAVDDLVLLKGNECNFDADTRLSFFEESFEETTTIGLSSITPSTNIENEKRELSTTVTNSVINYQEELNNWENDVSTTLKFKDEEISQRTTSIADFILFSTSLTSDNDNSSNSDSIEGTSHEIYDVPSKSTENSFNLSLIQNSSGTPIEPQQDAHDFVLLPAYGEEMLREFELERLAKSTTKKQNEKETSWKTEGEPKSEYDDHDYAYESEHHGNDKILGETDFIEPEEQHPTAKPNIFNKIHEGIGSLNCTFYILSGIVFLTVSIFIIICTIKIHARIKSETRDDEYRETFLPNNRNSLKFSSAPVSLQLVEVHYPTTVE